MWRLFTIMIQDINKVKEVFLYTFRDCYGQDVRSIYNRIADKYASTCNNGDVQFILNETLEEIFSEDDSVCFRKSIFGYIFDGWEFDSLIKHSDRIN